VGTVHLHLRALLHRGVSQADALALAHERCGEPRKSPDVRAGGLLAWLDSALYDHIIEALKISTSRIFREAIATKTIAIADC
jgi:hypothetical protein